MYYTVIKHDTLIEYGFLSNQSECRVLSVLLSVIGVSNVCACHVLSLTVTVNEMESNLVPRGFVSPDQRSENKSSGSNHFEKNKGNN